MIKTVLPTGKEIPFVRVGAQRIRIMFHAGHTVRFRIDGIGYDPEVRLTGKIEGYLFHVRIQLRTNTLAGGKEIFGDIDFALEVSIGNDAAFLIAEGKLRNIAEYGQYRAAETGNEP